MPAVSIIIPTYKHRDYVLETLDSVFAQTFTDYEVIVINDGSPDDTAALLRPLGEAGKITYVEQPNAGQSAARNRGLSMAAGEFIAFLDDDDRWRPDHLAWQVEVLRSTNAVAVAGKFQILVDGKLEPTTETHARESLTSASFYRHNPIFSPGQVLVRKSDLIAVGGFDADIWGADDIDLWMRLAAHGNLLFVDRVALDYRKHDGNASNAWERMLVNSRRVMHKNLHLLPEADRAEAMKVGELRMYFCNGSAAVQSIWSVRPKRWREAVRAIGQFAGYVVGQPKIGVAIVRDLVPRSVRRMLKPVHRPR